MNAEHIATTNYSVVTGEGATINSALVELEQAVKVQMEYGWEPLGAVVCCGIQWDERVFAQAMIKVEVEEADNAS